MILIFFKNLFTDLYRQPLRTILTLSGVTWGTFAIVLLLAFGDGVGKAGEKNIHGMGQGIIIVYPGVTTQAYKGFTKGKQVRITPEETLLIKQKVRGIYRISPEFLQNQRIRYKKEEFNNTVRGVNADFQYMRNTIAQKGRFINPLDVKLKRRICFLGSTIANNLFHDEEPIGKQVFVEGVPFTVVGVMIRKVQTSNYSGQQDEHCLFMPYTTFSSLYGQRYVNNMIIQPHLPEMSTAVISRLRHYLGEKIGFNPQDEDALFIWDFTELEQSMNVFFLAFNIFLAVIGAFTLLVGGVGVASIMLVVVEERTREIGVKLAVGAKRKQILRQFFSEALVIILLGGIIGFAMSALVLQVIPTHLIEDYVGNPRINYTVGMVTILILLAIGTVSGLMPARKAASTDPIEALRS
ncbi:MAG: ABC transporter permease [Candidatus Aminicenantes bacterium]|jgi:putative ABC transport system permease protein